MGRFKIIEDGKPRKVAWKDEVDNIAGVGRTTETVKENANRIGDLSNLTTTEKTNLSGAISEVKDELSQHKLDYMPHRFQDIKNNKKYKFGFQLSAEGNPQIIFEEVI